MPLHLPSAEKYFAAVNAEFFGDAVTGWGSAGGADTKHISPLDHPQILAMAAQPKA